MFEAIQPEGTIYVWSFSGFMLTTSQELGGFIIERSGFQLLFDSPKRLASPTWRPIPQFNEQNLHTIFPGAPKMAAMRIAVLPSVSDDGQPSLQSVWGDDQVVADLPKDTFPILVSGQGHAEEVGQVAGDALQEAFVWLRVLTKQWWIGRPTEALTGNLHLAVPISEGGAVKELPWGQAKATSPSAGTLRVDSAMWTDVLNKVSNNLSPNTIESLFTDANYYYFIGDYRIALLIACSITEIDRDRILEEANLKKSDLKAADTDILKQLSKGFEETIGRNMQVEAPKAFAFLKSCWIARGNVAHGKPLLWIQDGKPVSFDKLPSASFIEKLESVKAWLKTLP